MQEPRTPEQPARKPSVPFTPYTPARASAPASLTEEWERSQYVAFVSFINHVLKEDAVHSLAKDLKDGSVLFRVMEALKPGSMEGVRMRPAKNEFQALANCEAVVEGIREHVHLNNIGGRDLYEGTSMKLLLGLIWSIIYTLRISKSSKDKGGTGITPKLHFLKQLQDAVAEHGAAGGVETPYNLGKDLRDGKALACLLQSMGGEAPSLDLEPLELISRVQAEFERLGVPSVISAEDIAGGTADEKALLLYLSYLEEVMARNAEEEQKEQSSGEQLQKAESMVCALVGMTPAEVRAAFDNPALAQLMLTVQAQLQVVQQSADTRASDVVRGPRTSMMRDMLQCGKLTQERRRGIMRECTRERSGISSFAEACNVCGDDIAGDADTCYSCGLMVHPLCLAGVKPILGHLKPMPLCVLCEESRRVVPSRGFGFEPKQMVDTCICGGDFGALRWKHTCRSCGSVRCDSCCGRKTMVPGYRAPQRVCLECQEEAPAPPGSLARLSSILSPRFLMHQANLVHELPHQSTCCVATDDTMYCASGPQVFVFTGNGVSHVECGSTVEALTQVAGRVFVGAASGLMPLGEGEVFTGSEDVCSLLGVDGELLAGHPDGRLTRHSLDGALLGEERFEGAVVALTPNYVGTTRGIWKRGDSTALSTKGVRALAEVPATGDLWSCSRTSNVIKVFRNGQFTTVHGEDRVRSLQVLTINGEALAWTGDDGHISAWTLDEEQPVRKYHFMADGIVRGLCSPEEGEVWCVASQNVYSYKL